MKLIVYFVIFGLCCSFSDAGKGGKSSSSKSSSSKSSGGGWTSSGSKSTGGTSSGGGGWSAPSPSSGGGGWTSTGVKSTSGTSYGGGGWSAPSPSSSGGSSGGSGWRTTSETRTGGGGWGAPNQGTSGTSSGGGGWRVPNQGTSGTSSSGGGWGGQVNHGTSGGGWGGQVNHGTSGGGWGGQVNQGTSRGNSWGGQVNQGRGQGSGGWTSTSNHGNNYGGNNYGGVKSGVQTHVVYGGAYKSKGHYGNKGWGKSGKVWKHRYPHYHVVYVPSYTTRRYGTIDPVYSTYTTDSSPSTRATTKVHCYTCTGKGNDACVVNPMSVATRSICSSDQFCSIARVEWITEKNETNKAIDSIVNPANISVAKPVVRSEANETASSFFDTILNMTNIFSSKSDVEASNTTLDDAVDNDFNATTEIIPDSNATDIIDLDVGLTQGDLELLGMILNSTKKTINETNVMILRGCQPLTFIDSLMETGNEVGLQKYIQFCSSDNCNIGDGRLKCYQCTGNETSLCMTKPSTGAKVVVCPHSSICVTEITEDTNSTATAIVTRTCRSLNDNATDSDSGNSDIAQRCLSDLCNNIGLDALMRSNANRNLNAIVLLLTVLGSMLLY